MKHFAFRDGKCIHRHLLRLLGPNIVYYQEIGLGKNLWTVPSCLYVTVHRCKGAEERKKGGAILVAKLSDVHPHYFRLFFSFERNDIHRLCCWFEGSLNYACSIAYARDFRVCRSGLFKRKDDIRSVGNFHLLQAYFHVVINTQPNR